MFFPIQIGLFCKFHFVIFQNNCFDFISFWSKLFAELVYFALSIYTDMDQHAAVVIKESYIMHM